MEASVFPILGFDEGRPTSLEPGMPELGCELELGFGEFPVGGGLVGHPIFGGGFSGVEEGDHAFDGGFGGGGTTVGDVGLGGGGLVGFVGGGGAGREEEGEGEGGEAERGAGGV